MAAPMVVASLIALGKELIEKFVPDPQAKAEAAQELMRMDLSKYEKQITADIQSDLAQVEVNKIEAASDDKFKSRWRPALGWVCVAGLGYQFLLRPLLILGLVIGQVPADYAVFDLDVATLTTIVFGMLGLGYYRTREKERGVA